MQQEHQNARSNKLLANRIDKCNYQENNEELVHKDFNHILSSAEINENYYPSISPQSNDVIFKIEQTAKKYFDQTGKFPFPSSRGYQYILIAYDVDSNAILSRPLKSKLSTEMCATLLGLIDMLTQQGFTP